MLRSEIAIRQGTIEEIVAVDELLDRGEIVTLLEQRLVEHFGSESPLLGPAYRIGITFVSPNLLMNVRRPNRRLPRRRTRFPHDGLRPGKRADHQQARAHHAGVAPEAESLQRARADRGLTADDPAQKAGTVLHVILAIGLFVIYLGLFRKKITGNPRRLALIALLFLLICFLAYLTRELDVAAPIEYLIPVAAASMMLTIIFDSR